MREIKFRGWNGTEMIYQGGFLFNQPNTLLIKNCCEVLLMAGIESGEVIYEGADENCEIMQYTGLKDKNGKEICEGDVCKCIMNGIEAHQEIVTTEVIYDLTVGAFGHKVISKNSDYKFFGLNSKNLIQSTIIGNIYEKQNAPHTESPT